MIVNRKIANSRYEICKTCDQLNSIKFCNQCLCFMPAKVVWNISECPLGKWPQAPEDPSEKEFYEVDK